MIDKPKVIINKTELEKIKWYVNKCPVEISGLGNVVKLEDGSLYVNKIYLLEQECSSVDTELDDEAVAKLLFESYRDEGQLLFWWHSHHTMDVFWSATDYEAIEELGKNGMIVASVFNKKGEIRTAIYSKGDETKPDMFIDEIDLQVPKFSLNAQEIADLEKQYDEKITISKPTVVSNCSYRGAVANPQSWDDLVWMEKVDFRDAYNDAHQTQHTLTSPEHLRDIKEYAKLFNYNVDEVWGYESPYWNQETNV